MHCSSKMCSAMKEQRFNTSTTDSLLPSRRGTAVQMETKLRGNDAIQNVTMVSRPPTPIPVYEKPKKMIKYKMTGNNNVFVEEDNAISNHSSDPAEQCDTDELTITELDVTNKRGENIVIFDIAKDEKYASSVADKGDSCLTLVPLTDKPGTISDIYFQTTQELHSESQCLPVPNTLYEKELEKSRLSRKRKRTRNKKADYTPRLKHRDKTQDTVPERLLKRTLNIRPSSGTSTWTTDSKISFGSTDSLTIIDSDMAKETKTDRYSYINSGTIPINFKQFTPGANTELVDLEDEGEDINNDSLLTDEQDQTEQLDVWFGMKPYEVFTSTGERDTGVVKTVASGPSSSECNTKQKLMYSRFARRPQSESVLRRAAKPPLPPGSELKIRPTSETVRRPHAFSKHFTTDLDIH